MTKLSQTICQAIPDGLFSVDKEFRITFFSPSAEEITGIKAEDAIGRTCWEVLHSNLCENSCPLNEALNSGQPVTNRIASIVNAEGQRISISLSAGILTENRDVIGGIETFRDITSLAHLKRAAAKDYSCQDILSINSRMRKIFEIIPTIAASNSTVLITGETGTGKEMLAQAVHNLSERDPFVAVNCAALPDNLLESELFGYRKGAFTGATQNKAGRFQLADGGTIFLDEIGDISPALQVRLLRVLQETEFEPLGSTQRIKSDVRVVAATNCNLEELVEAGKFRRDLYYRLNVIKLELPPLRERREDIGLLAEHFVDKFNQEQHKELSLSRESLQLLTTHDYPGNIRELENMIERAFVLCPQGEITPELFSIDKPLPKAARLKDIEDAVILDTLKRNNGNRIKTAQELGIHKTTLYRRLKKIL